MRYYSSLQHKGLRNCSLSKFDVRKKPLPNKKHFRCKYFNFPQNNPIYTVLLRQRYHINQQDSRDSSPKPSSNMLDSLCPNCSATLKNAQQCSTIFINALKHSDMLINAQQCSTMLKNFEIEHLSMLAF